MTPSQRIQERKRHHRSAIALWTLVNFAGIGIILALILVILSNIQE